MLSGLLIKVVKPIRLSLLIVLISLFLSSFPIVKQYMPEARLPESSRNILWSKVRKRFRIFLVALMMACAGLGLSAIVLAGSGSKKSGDETSPTRWSLYQLIYSVVASILLCISGFWALPKTLAMCNLYLFLQETLYVQISGSIDYWYTANEDCVPGGPGFSYIYYITWSGIIGCIAGIAGVVLFQRYCSNWTFRQCFWIAIMVRLVAASFDIVIINRVNLRIGIPDSAMYLLGDSIVSNMLMMLAFMPSCVLTAKICPKEMEATVYSLLAGFQNFGVAVASAAGLYLQSAFDVEMSNRKSFDCKYGNLTWLIVVAHILLPLLTIPLTFVLIPDARLGDDILTKIAADEESNYEKGAIALRKIEDDPASPLLQDYSEEHYNSLKADG